MILKHIGIELEFKINYLTKFLLFSAIYLPCTCKKAKILQHLATSTCILLLKTQSLCQTDISKTVWINAWPSKNNTFSNFSNFWVQKFHLWITKYRLPFSSSCSSSDDIMPVIRVLLKCLFDSSLSNFELTYFVNNALHCLLAFYGLKIVLSKCLL